MKSYYNENDPYAAQWLRNLIEAGHIAKGDVDERSITDVEPADLTGYTQCHFFAGIGGWSYALRLAGWPDDMPVWTGSCPCQPFSAPGQRRGFSDDRHLWPSWFKLIEQCKPTAVFGEQVAQPIALQWLDGVFDDMEGIGYSCGAAIIPACSVDAPHKRERLWFVANTARELPHGCRHTGAQRWDESANRSGDFWGDAEILLCSDGKKRRIKPGVCLLAHGVRRRSSRLRAYGNAIVPQVAAEFIRACFLE